MRATAPLTPARPVADDLGIVLRHRLEQTGPTAHEVAGLAAALGRDFSLDVLVEASDLDADTVVRAVDELWRRRIVQERGGAYDFAHDLLRDAAYAQVSPPRRWLLHRRLA
jgi:predicted ATPase